MATVRLEGEESHHLVGELMDTNCVDLYETPAGEQNLCCPESHRVRRTLRPNLKDRDDCRTAIRYFEVRSAISSSTFWIAFLTRLVSSRSSARVRL